MATVRKCDECSHTSESPDGWVRIEMVTLGDDGESAGIGATRRGEFHSRSCAAAWVGKRVRAPRKAKIHATEGGPA